LNKDKFTINIHLEPGAICAASYLDDSGQHKLLLNYQFQLNKSIAVTRETNAAKGTSLMLNNRVELSAKWNTI